MSDRHPDSRDHLRTAAPRPDDLRDENPRQGAEAPREWLSDNEPRGHFGRGPRGYRRSDDRIREEVCDRLMVHPDVDASDIEVDVENGIVTLSGTVEDRRQKRIAEFLAEDGLGVNDVYNRLHIRRGFWSSPQTDRPAQLTAERTTERTTERTAERALSREPEIEREASESGRPGGGAGRRDAVGKSGVYPMSGGLPPNRHLEHRTPAAWGQGDRGAEGYDDAGGSELVLRNGELLGGLTAGPSGEPTIDIHSDFRELARPAQSVRSRGTSPKGVPPTKRKRGNR